MTKISSSLVQSFSLTDSHLFSRRSYSGIYPSQFRLRTYAPGSSPARTGCFIFVQAVLLKNPDGISAYDLYRGFPVASASLRRKETAIRSAAVLYLPTISRAAPLPEHASSAFFPNQLVNHPARRFLPADLHKAFKVERRLRCDPDRHFPRFLLLLLHVPKTSVLRRYSPEIPSPRSARRVSGPERGPHR